MKIKMNDIIGYARSISKYPEDIDNSNYQMITDNSNGFDIQIVIGNKERLDINLCDIYLKMI